MPGWLHIKILTLIELLRPEDTLTVHDLERIAPFVAANKQQPAAVRRDLWSSSAAESRSDRLRQSRCQRLTVDAARICGHKIHYAILDRELTAAVTHTAARRILAVEFTRRLPVRRLRQDHAAIRPALHPEQAAVCVPFERRNVDPTRQAGRRDGALPQSVGCTAASKRHSSILLCCSGFDFFTGSLGNRTKTAPMNGRGSQASQGCEMGCRPIA